MTKQEFIQELEFVLEAKAGMLNENTELATITGWDSTGLLGVIALLDELDVKVNVDKLAESRTVADIIDLAGHAVE